jgi:hypothetical protein
LFISAANIDSTHPYRRGSSIFSLKIQSKYYLNGSWKILHA